MSAQSEQMGPPAPEAVSIESADSMLVKLGGQKVKVRIADIEAPVPDQPGFKRAVNMLKRLTLRRSLVLTPLPDRPGYYRVRVGDADLAAELVGMGYAWVDRLHVKELRLYTLEAAARDKKRGIWREPHPLPPHEWSAGRRPLQALHATLAGLVLADGRDKSYYTEHCAQTLIPESHRFLFARVQDAIKAGFRRQGHCD